MQPATNPLEINGSELNAEQRAIAADSYHNLAAQAFSNELNLDAALNQGASRGI